MSQRSAVLPVKAVTRLDRVYEAEMPDDTDERLPIQLVSLDDWTESEGIDPAAIRFVKVDVEGFEGRVLLGAEIAPVRWPAGGTGSEGFQKQLIGNFTTLLDFKHKELGARPIREIDDVISNMEGIKTDILVIP